MATLLKDAEVQAKLPSISQWQQKGKEIQRQWKFADFNAAMEFVNKVAVEAERMDHHPDILIQYNRVTMTLSTHSAGGLTELDFELAKKIDALK